MYLRETTRVVVDRTLENEVLAGYDGEPGLAYGFASDHRFGGELRQDVEDDIIRDARNGAHGLPWSTKVFVTSAMTKISYLSYTTTMGGLWFARDLGR